MCSINFFYFFGIFIAQKEKDVDPDTLLRWCKEQTKSYSNVHIVDMSLSWQNGLGFCAIIHRYRPELV